MQFNVPVEVEIISTSGLTDMLVTAKISLLSYGWETVKIRPGKPIGPRKSVVNFEIGGKVGASKVTAEKDVTDAILGVPNHVRLLRVIQSKIEDIPGKIGEGVGKGVSGFGEGSGLGGGIGALAFGATATALIVGVAIVALVLSVRVGRA